MVPTIGPLTVARGVLLRVSVVIGLTCVSGFGMAIAFCGVAAMSLALLVLPRLSGRQTA